MYKILITTASQFGGVCQTVIEFNDRRAADNAMKQIQKFSDAYEGTLRGRVLMFSIKLYEDK